MKHHKDSSPTNHRQSTTSNTSLLKIRHGSITYSDKVALINLVSGMNTRSHMWSEIFVMLLQFPVEFRGMLRALSEVDITRIGRCPICDRFFAKLRRDQKCCGWPKPCANTYRVRRWRRDYQEKYKARRISRAEAKETTADSSQGRS
jgi:hypothetical protein